MTRRKTDLDKFLGHVAAASKTAGDAAALAAYAEHFRLARQVIQLRQQEGWTQQQLAKASGIQQSEISRIERGQGNPTFRTLQALASSGRMTVAFVSARISRVTARKPLKAGGRKRAD